MEEMRNKGEVSQNGKLSWQIAAWSQEAWSSAKENRDWKVSDTEKGFRIVALYT